MMFKKTYFFPLIFPHPKAVHVYVEVDEVIHFSDYILLITSYILNKYEEKCAEVVFLSKGTLNMYTDKYEKPTRFEFRDDLLLKKINNGIIHVLNSDEDVLGLNFLIFGHSFC
jgi:hypothetical protein